MFLSIRSRYWLAGCSLVIAGCNSPAAPGPQAPDMAAAGGEVSSAAARQVPFAIVGGPAVSGISASGATVTWSLNRNGTGRVEYGTSSKFGNFSVLESSFDYRTHVQDLTGLKPNTLYVYRVISVNKAGLRIVSANATFRTLANAPAPVPPPSPAPAPSPAPVPVPAPTPTPDTTASWPLLRSVPEGTAPSVPAMSAPGYLQWSTDAGSLPPYASSGGIPTEITRVSDNAAFGLTDNFYKISYSKTPAWNADDSLLMIYRNGGGAGILLDGKTFRFKKILSSVSGSGRWANADPKKFYQINYSKPELDVVDVTTGVSSVVRNFADLGYTTNGSIGLFAGEGRQSNDDKFWPLLFGKADGTWDLIIYNRAQNTITGVIPLPAKPGDNYIDNWGMSQSGQFVVVQSSAAWSLRNGARLPAGINVFSTAGQYLRTSPGKVTGHVDYAVDAAGYDVLFFIGSKYEGNDHVGQTWRLDGANGNGTVDQFKEAIGWSYHISAANTARPGWAIVTSAPHERPSDYNWAPMWNKTFAVKLDGSLRLAPIANLHHSNGPATVETYDRMPFGCPNRALSAVIWGTTWGDADVSRPIQSYVARPKIP